MLASLLDDARAGRSGVIVIRGEPGIGKSALLADAVAGAADLRVLHISGAESEMELPYAGIQQLCTPLLGFVRDLPEPQKRALHVALGRGDGAAPDRLLVGLAVLTLLGEAGRAQPIACVVDDAQWVDTASLQALAIVARRILAEPLAMLFAARQPGGGPELAGLPDLALRGLAEPDARALLAAMVPGRLDERVRENIIAEADGNPLALLELHNALTPGGLAGGYGLASAASRATRIERTFGLRVRELPTATRTLLLLAAAEPAGRPEWLWASAGRLGVGVEAAAPAEAAGLITVDGGIRFRHPLIRAAIYRDASVPERRRVHAALAQAIIGPAADEYRVWHRAHATSAPDEQVANELENSAQRAHARGGVAAAAAFLAYATALSPDPAHRARRALAAAQAKLDAGAPDAAAQLLTIAGDAVDDELLSARTELLRARISFATSRGSDTPPLLLAAARRLAPLDAALARDTYLEALTAAILVGRLSSEPRDSAPAVADAARRAPPAGEPPRAVDLLLDGLVVRLTDGHAAAAPLLRRAIDTFLREEEAGTAEPRWHDLTHRVCLDLFDQDTYNFLCARQLEALRAAGALSVLPVAQVTYAGLCVTGGQFAKAAAALEESGAIITATGAPLPGSVPAYLAAYRGQEALCLKLAGEAIDAATRRGEGFDIAVALYAEAILHTGLGQYPEALAAASSAARYDDVGMSGYVLAELVEAASRCGEHSLAADAATRLAERTSASGTDTGLGLAARATALTGAGAVAEEAYRQAISYLERSPAVMYLPRTHLVYGEWLRRTKRRADARTQLRIAHDMFMRIGANGFAGRAHRELNATGETVYTRPADVTVDLTTQETHIARLARDGYTNPEIAGQLFISPRTVEWHLGKVFAKLGVTSRRELRNARIDLP